MPKRKKNRKAVTHKQGEYDAAQRLLTHRADDGLTPWERDLLSTPQPVRGNSNGMGKAKRKTR